MKTEAMMERVLDGHTIRQSNQTEMFNVNDLLKGFNEQRRAQGLSEKHLTHYWANDSTQEFMEALEVELNLITRDSVELKVSRRGKFRGTWVVPEVFVDIAMWLNPRFKAKVMIWVSDNLLGVRNTSGVQQVLMNRELEEKFPDRTTRWLIVRMSKRINEYILEDGIGVKENKELAIKWLRESYKNGSEQAKEHLDRLE